MSNGHFLDLTPYMGIFRASVCGISALCFSDSAFADELRRGNAPSDITGPCEINEPNLTVDQALEIDWNNSKNEENVLNNLKSIICKLESQEEIAEWFQKAGFRTIFQNPRANSDGKKVVQAYWDAEANGTIIPRFGVWHLISRLFVDGQIIHIQWTADGELDYINLMTQIL